MSQRSASLCDKHQLPGCRQCVIMNQLDGYETVVWRPQHDPPVPTGCITIISPIKNIIVAHSSLKFQYDSLMSRWLCVCVSLWCLAQQQQNSVGLTVSITAVSQWQKKKKGSKGCANYWGKYLNREKRRRYGGKKGKPYNELEGTFISFIYCSTDLENLCVLD